MRLTEKEITSIKAVTNLVFGENACVFLFGSRTEDNSSLLINMVKEHGIEIAY
jgi:hypothetical protein